MNFFTDNEDLKFIFNTADISDIISAFEEGFAQKSLYDYAPESVDDAMDSYRRVLETAGSIAGEIIEPLRQELDEQQNILQDGRVIFSNPIKECLKALSQADLMGCTVSRKYGGLNLPAFIFTMIVEMVSRAEAGIQNLFGLQGISSIIETFADDELKQRYLPAFAKGEVTGAMALTEDEAGSDLQNVRLKAYQDNEGNWRLSGVKRFITNGGADVLLVLARSEQGTVDGLGLSLFLCEGDETVVVRRLEDKLGIHSSPTCEIAFNDTKAYLIGERQRGLVTYVLALLNGARLATAAQSVGIAHAAFNEARVYAHTRKQYGRRIESIPAVAEMLIRMKISTEAARAITYETALVMDRYVAAGYILGSDNIDTQQKKDTRKNLKKLERTAMLLTALAKYYASEMSVRVTSDAIQVMGGSGYMRDYPLEKFFRDARITTIYEGTSQMQVVGAFRSILNGTMERYFDDFVRNNAFTGKQSVVAKKLLKARSHLSATVDYLNCTKDNQLMDLCARDVVDIASDILAGYLFLKQSKQCSRKLKIAKMFIEELVPVAKMRAVKIKRTNRSGLTSFSLITDQ